MYGEIMQQADVSALRLFEALVVTLPETLLQAYVLICTDIGIKSPGRNRSHDLHNIISAECFDPNYTYTYNKCVVCICTSLRAAGSNLSPDTINYSQSAFFFLSPAL